MILNIFSYASWSFMNLLLWSFFEFLLSGGFVLLSYFCLLLQSLPGICRRMLFPVSGLSFYVPPWWFLNSLFLTLPKSHFTFDIFCLLFQEYNITTARFHGPNLLLCTFSPLYSPSTSVVITTSCGYFVLSGYYL